MELKLPNLKMSTVSHIVLHLLLLAGKNLRSSNKNLEIIFCIKRPSLKNCLSVNILWLWHAKDRFSSEREKTRTGYTFHDFTNASKVTTKSSPVPIFHLVLWSKNLCSAGCAAIKIQHLISQFS